MSNRMVASPAPKMLHLSGWNHSANHPANQPDPVFPNGNATVEGYPVPGLGFDYTHYFATHPNAGPCHHCFGNGVAGSFVGGGYYLPLPTYYYGDESGEQQPADQAAAPEENLQAEQTAGQDYTNYPPSWNAPQPTPKQEAEYVFVKRDGTLIFAVAYSWINDRLQYVNEEGLRRSIPASSIDIDATQQFNDQRGVPIRLPA